MTLSRIRIALLGAACMFVAAPSALAQQAGPDTRPTGIAARILEHINNPSTEVQRALSADSLRTPGGLWNAAALLQAELSADEKEQIIAAASQRGRRWRGQRRPSLRSSRGRNQRNDSGRRRQQASRSRDFRGGSIAREASREAWEALKDSALTVQERRDAIAEAVREAEEAERQAAAERARAQLFARDAALGIDAETRTAMDAELEALRAAADTLRQQANAARQALRTFRAESNSTDAFTPAQQEVTELHAAIGRLIQSRSRRNLSRNR